MTLDPSSPPPTPSSSVPPSGGAAAAVPLGRACACGHDTTSHMVSPSGEYTFFGWCMILIGISADPVAVHWTCRRCQAEVYRTTDKAVIQRTRLFG